MKLFFAKEEQNPSVKESVFSCSRDGMTIRGTEYRPEGEHLPIAVVSHGFMAFQDTVRRYAKLLAALGYVSYCFDFCGGCIIRGKSDGKTSEMSVLTEVKDLKQVICYAQGRTYTDAGKVLLMGCSQGGLVSALAAAEYGDAISELVLFSPAFCIPDDARAGRMMYARFDPEHIPDTIWCGPMKLGRQYVEDVIHMDPFRETAGFMRDVLIVHGTEDGIVNLSYAERAYESYLDSRRKNHTQNRVELRLIQEGGHSFSGDQDRMAVQYLKDFVTGV